MRDLHETHIEVVIANVFGHHAGEVGFRHDLAQPVQSERHTTHRVHPVLLDDSRMRGPGDEIADISGQIGVMAKPDVTAVPI